MRGYNPRQLGGDTLTKLVLFNFEHHWAWQAAGAETWHQILNAIERLRAKVPAEGNGVQ